jgi:hypothetical protein
MAIGRKIEEKISTGLRITGNTDALAGKRLRRTLETCSASTIYAQRKRLS